MNNKNKLRYIIDKKLILLKIQFIVCLIIITLLKSQIIFANNVKKIILSGNSYISDDIILDNLELKNGQKITNNSINSAITSLYSTGLFKKIKIFSRNNNLYVTIKENPIINSIKFIGNKNISSEILNSISELKSKTYFTKTKIKLAINNIKKKYILSRYKKIQVNYKIINLNKNKINLIFNIIEGPSFAIKKITFLGNKIYSNKFLKNIILSKEPDFLNFLFNSNNFNIKKINHDQKLLYQHYFENGYIDFNIISINVKLDKNSNKYLITFNINEGKQYSFGKIEVDSAFSDLSPNDILSIIKTKYNNVVYNYKKIEETIKIIKEKINYYGYKYAKVTPLITNNKIKKTIDVVYTIEIGNHIYVEQINITGNIKTYDEVIRREFLIAEGDIFDIQSIHQTKLRLEKIGFFKKINISTSAGSVKDRIVINIEVLEDTTGEIGAQASFSTLKGLIGSIKYKEKNLFGTSRQLSSSISWDKKEKIANFNFIEPKFMSNNLNIGINLFTSYGIDKDKDNHFKYGIGLNAGLLLNKLTTINTRYNFIFDNNIKTNTKDFISIIGTNFIYDTRDKIIMPKKGFKIKNNIELAGIIDNVKYIRFINKNENHFQIIDDIIFSNYLQFGIIKSINNIKLRQQDTFFKGEDLVRGFSPNGLGPRSYNADNLAKGGTIYMGFTSEITTPIIKNKGIYTGLFLDIGTLYKSSFLNSISNNKEFRSSIGVSLIWYSPIGPLRADYAYVIKKNNHDILQPFKFGIAIRY